MIKPDYLPDETWRLLRKSAMMRAFGHLNVYTCETCAERTITTDLDEGTTPFTIACRNEGCSGYAVSAMYRILARVPITPTHAWFRPKDAAEMKTVRNHDTVDHIMRGGLILRELRPDELEILR